MAAPQSFVPPKVSASRSTRRFTLEQANRTLPLVKRIVADIVSTHERFTKAQDQVQNTSGREQIDAQTELDRAMDRLHELVDELSEVGAEVKDYQIGLIDFVSRHQGRDIYLCWKLGEDTITHWHELRAGFAGRQPVSMLDVESKGSGR